MNKLLYKEASDENIVCMSNENRPSASINKSKEPVKNRLLIIKQFPFYVTLVHIPCKGLEQGWKRWLQ